ncbi:phasin family protein [Azotobacter chroococcum]|jgi:phasin family protein|uniref:Phasin family protein n=1 Tax=Azotobacter chroococcum TaxID=353 RepID=A0A4Q9VMS5_9GAMM|nr:phasin family protein [Azotobacter chroococcum]MEE4465047.1 phasin family protein [Azotobacter chroococcum]QQE90511.1 phasin family protein [Azotobacter chroococcum]TBV97564.1 phasin family protein [Azotobacter chroococcum]TBW07941.1 phasin family protein [Azotobacter chroococcum]TBW36889.1 phasin family protein [Azotobacter chroococcum]
MSFFDLEKMESASKSNLDAVQQLNSKIFESAEELYKLQFKTLRAAADDNFESLRKLLSVRDPQAFLELQASFFKPNEQAERLVEFSRQTYDLISRFQAEVTKLTERQIEIGTQQAQEIVEEICKNAPASAEPVVSVFKSAVEGAGNVYESAQKAAKQASEITASGIEAAANAAGQAAAQAASGKKTA